MGITPLENLKNFASTRPPVVVFMVCLSLFAGALLTFAYYIRSHEVRNPDITRDWNVFLKNFAELEFCVVGSNNESHINPNVSRIPVTRDIKENKLKKKNIDSESQLRNFSVSLLLTVQPTIEFINHRHNVTHISGAMYGHELGLTGFASDELINITAALPFEWNTTICSGVPYGCQTIKIYTCVNFVAPSYVFPNSRSPPICENNNEVGLEYHAKVRAHKPQKMFTTYYCRSRPVIKVDYTYNPKLAVWLSMYDRSIINLHLTHTSYFLFVMVITLLCYAIIRGKFSSMKRSAMNSNANDSISI